MLNFSEISNDTGIPVSTVREYYYIPIVLQDVEFGAQINEQIWTLFGQKTAGIAGYFEDFLSEERSKMSLSWDDKLRRLRYDR